MGEGLLPRAEVWGLVNNYKPHPMCERGGEFGLLGTFFGGGGLRGEECF